jgi:hypothetical protein
MNRVRIRPQFTHRFQRRGVEGVAAEIAQEVGVFFENDDLDSRPRQEIRQHHPGRSAAGDTTADPHLLW